METVICARGLIDDTQAFMAKFCFSLGMNLKRIEVIADDESEIIEAARRMSENYDFVVTSGGIGPTYEYPFSYAQHCTQYPTIPEKACLEIHVLVFYGNAL